MDFIVLKMAHRVYFQKLFVNYHQLIRHVHNYEREELSNIFIGSRTRWCKTLEMEYYNKYDTIEVTENQLYGEHISQLKLYRKLRYQLKSYDESWIDHFLNNISFPISNNRFNQDDKFEFMLNAYVGNLNFFREKNDESH